MAEFNRRKKKVCAMCTGKDVDYKDPETLRRYINEITFIPCCLCCINDARSKRHRQADNRYGESKDNSSYSAEWKSEI